MSPLRSPPGANTGLLRLLRKLVSLLSVHELVNVSQFADSSVVDETRCEVRDPETEASETIDRRFPVEAAVSLREFHGELVADGTISEQAAVTYGLRFLEHMLGAVWPDADDEDADDD